MIALMLGLSAWATPTVLVTTNVEGGQLSSAAVQSVVWHSLAHRHGHDALMLADDLTAAETQMRERQIPTLYRFDVIWHMEALLVDSGVLTARRPTVTVAEYRLDDGKLVQVGRWQAIGGTAVFAAAEGQISLPEVALQEAVDDTVAQVRPPVWTLQPDRIAVPVRIYADEEYRARYGDGWTRVAEARLQRAAWMLAQAGLTLEVVSHDRWESPDDSVDLSALLASLAASSASVHATDRPAIRIGFTGQVSGHWDGTAEDVGRAYLPGREVVIADMDQPPGHNASWDVADEAITVAHELVHALGVPHHPQPAFLMSETKTSTVHIMSESTRHLARAAALARYQDWDSVMAMQLLSTAAERWLRDPELQLDYITENLESGPGMPSPDAVRRGSALTHRAIGHYWAGTEQAQRRCLSTALWGECKD